MARARSLRAASPPLPKEYEPDPVVLSATARLRRQFKAYEAKHGAENLISVLKIELVSMGEGAKHVEKLTAAAERRATRPNTQTEQERP